MTDFPDHWIPPGEFRWCNNGFHLLPFPTCSPCPICKGDKPKTEDELWRAIHAYEFGMRKMREILAKTRHELGVPPLAWMNDGT